MTTENELFTEVDTTTAPVTPEPVENAYEALVGEGKKFKDNEALAKAALEKDSFIERLQNEQAEVRKELEKRMTIDEFMTKLEEKRLESGNSSGVNHTPEPSHEEISEATGLSKEDVSKMLQEELGKQTAEQRKASNLKVAIDEVTKVWGADAQFKLNERARELGISLNELKEHASSNPKVFLNLVGVNQTTPQAQNTTSVYQPSVDTAKQPSANYGEKTFSYYDKLRKENPKAYFTPKVQNEMHKQALKLKEDFYK